MELTKEEFEAAQRTPNKEMRRFCNNAVLLARLDKCVYLNNEIFKARLEVGNYRNKKLDLRDLKVIIRDSEHNIIKEQEINGSIFSQGNAQYIADFEMSLSSLKVPAKYNLEVVSPNNNITRVKLYY